VFLGSGRSPGKARAYERRIISLIACVYAFMSHFPIIEKGQTVLLTLAAVTLISGSASDSKLGFSISESLACNFSSRWPYLSVLKLNAASSTASLSSFLRDLNHLNHFLSCSMKGEKWVGSTLRVGAPHSGSCLMMVGHPVQGRASSEVCQGKLAEN
jgi:hypothetical protein